MTRELPSRHATTSGPSWQPRLTQPITLWRSAVPVSRCLHIIVCQKTRLMTEIFRNRDSATIGHLQSLLESEGIRTHLRDEHGGNTAFPVVTPALCILDDADVERGVELIRAYIESSRASSNEEQTCPQCGETCPGTFAVCWKCGAALDSRSW
jgi:hypothetical protein